MAMMQKQKNIYPPPSQKDVWVKVTMLQNEFIDFFSSVCVLRAAWTGCKSKRDTWGATHR